jgi:5-(carboxyamino)imidazole ribonucleotide synthase
MNILVLGAGQLARMMSLEAAPLNLNVRAYDVGTMQVVHPLTLHSFEQTLEEAIAFVDMITCEFEHIPDDVLTLCCASGKFFPGKAAIKAGGDRSIEKALLDKTGVPSAPYKLITAKQQLVDSVSLLGLPLVIKTCQAGYDGKGQWRLKSADQLDAIWAEMAGFIAAGTDAFPHTIIAEKMIPFNREVSVIGVRDKAGNIAIYPVTENQHTDGVLTLSLAAEIDLKIQQQAIDAFKKLSTTMDYVGVLAIEFFDVDGQLMVNEIAPRVHNSGHWTQQGTACSQFENHMRAVAGLPLGDTKLQKVSAMINVLGQASINQQVLSISDVKSHWYGKEQRAGRKMGHINVSAETNAALAKKLLQLAEMLPEQDYPGIKSTAQRLLES